MADSTTIARPYAKAIFQYALSVNKLGDWSQILYCFAESVANEALKRFIQNPATIDQQHCDLLLSVLSEAYKGEVPESAGNLIRLLALNKRLLLLPDMCIQFEVLRAEHEKTQEVMVTSFAPLTAEQEHALVQKLTEKLHRQVTLDVSIDEKLLGGAIIQAGDLVIDGSVRGKLKELDRALTE